MTTRMIAFLLSVALGLIIVVGCDTVRGDKPTKPVTTLADVPGITADELAAGEGLRQRYDSFVYAMPPSTEAFSDIYTAEINGFSRLFCDWLTALFGIEFIPENRLFAEVTDALEKGTADFTGTMTATDERREKYHMTSPIAVRTLKYFRLEGSAPLPMIQTVRPVKFALLEGSSVADKAIDSLNHSSYEIVYVQSNLMVYDMLVSGEVDAFIHESATEEIFDEYDDVVAIDFLPIVMSSVSLTAYSDELEPVITIVQKALNKETLHMLSDMYNEGYVLYLKNKLHTRLSDTETAYIQGADKIRVVAECDNYPISFYNKHEKAFQGICIDVLNQVSLFTGLEFEVVNEQGAGWSAILEMLDNGEASMVTELIRTRERERSGKFRWPDTPIFHERYALISKVEHRNININEILYVRIGLLEQSAHTDLFNGWFPNHEYTTTYAGLEEAFAALEADEIDMVMGGLNQVLSQTNFHEKPGYKANLVFDDSYGSTFGFNADEEMLCSIVDKALVLIDTNATEQYWTRKTFDYRSQIQQLRFVGITGAIVVLLCFILLINMSVSRKRLKRESRYKSSFLAVMSHEIRTPMNSILGITQMQLRDNTLSPTQTEALNKIYNSGSTLLEIINDILDMSKIETGKLEINTGTYEVASMIHDAVQLNTVRIGGKDIVLRVNADKELPSQLVGDELRLKQILNNLLSNAIKYTEKGHVTLTVTFLPDESMLRFSVEDTGQGMKPADRDRLFTENYLRFNMEYNRRTEGTGLGLNITRELVSCMGGKIGVESEFGKGSTFTATVHQDTVKCAPIGEEIAANLMELNYSRKQERRASIRNIMPNCRVLIVDDVETNLYVAEGLMSPYMLKSETALSGFKAIELVESGKAYDIIFMDHMMPQMDGIETTKKLRDGGYKGAIIALTANALVGNAEMFIQNGFDDFISKPIDIRRLDNVLNKWLTDKQPNTAATPAPARADVSPKLLEVFRKDAARAVPILRNHIGDPEQFIITVHAMKSALANIGRVGESAQAERLERTAREHGRLDEAQVKAFAAAVEALAVQDAPETQPHDDSDAPELVALLRTQLTAVKRACDEYDDSAAIAALDVLNDKQACKATRAFLSDLHDLIYLESHFEKATEAIDAYLQELK
ncbi:MAG: ATP-binding protein [Oscillospiraceae bacterium]|nr:ATP-binding protein [Oscillospiraceae bacterium]